MNILRVSNGDIYSYARHIPTHERIVKRDTQNPYSPIVPRGDGSSDAVLWKREEIDKLNLKMLWLEGKNKVLGRFEEKLEYGLHFIHASDEWYITCVAIEK